MTHLARRLPFKRAVECAKRSRTCDSVGGKIGISLEAPERRDSPLPKDPVRRPCAVLKLVQRTLEPTDVRTFVACPKDDPLRKLQARRGGRRFNSGWCTSSWSSFHVGWIVAKGDHCHYGRDEKDRSREGADDETRVPSSSRLRGSCER